MLHIYEKNLNYVVNYTKIKKMNRITRNRNIAKNISKTMLYDADDVYEFCKK